MCTPQPAGRIRLNVGGQVFETTTDTLTSAGEGTMLSAMMDPCWNARGASTTGGVPEHFIDRDPACFASLLDMLRTGELHVPVGVPERVLFREALYYGLLDRVRAARIGKFNIDRIHLTASVPSGRAPIVCSAVRAAPDGGCCVTHGATVRVYNWMLEERQPVCPTPAASVRDAAYLSASTLLVGGSGMAAFSALTGDLSHHFRIEHAGEKGAPSFNVRALAFDQQARIFASCNCKCIAQESGYNGIGIWDCITGERTGSLLNKSGTALGDARKLQWLPSTNALMAFKMCSRLDSGPVSSSISLVDFRDMSVVWSWSRLLRWNGSGLAWDDKRIEDAVVMEDERTVCLINQYHDLEFLDIRRLNDAIEWTQKSEKPTSSASTCYPKLAVHGGLLMASKDDTISVFDGRKHVLKLALQGSKVSGAISDFTVGGDRIFAVHKDDNVLDVWETPPPPIV